MNSHSLRLVREVSCYLNLSSTIALSIIVGNDIDFIGSLLSLFVDHKTTYNFIELDSIFTNSYSLKKNILLLVLYDSNMSSLILRKNF